MARNTPRLRGGARQSRFDPRDAIWSAPPSSGGPVWLRPPFPAREQGPMRCCVPAAICGAMEILGRPSTPLSTLYLYYHARPLQSILGAVETRSALKAAQQIGVCPEHAHPGCAPGGPPPRPEDGLRPPPSSTTALAGTLRLARGADVPGAGYFRIRASDRAAQWEAALRAGRPVVVVIPLVPELPALRNAPEPLLRHVSHPATPDQHAVLLAGVDEHGFRVRDTQGPRFGVHGDWWLTRELADSDFVQESWVINSLAG